MQQKRNQQAEIRLGSHGEDYGSWMSNPVFYIIGGITALAVVLAILSFSVFHITALGVLFSVVTAALAALLVWITWIRRQYAFGGGGIMEQVHRVVLSHLDYATLPRLPAPVLHSSRQFPPAPLRPHRRLPRNTQ